MQASGISLVNLANNHTFDAEERGFLDTLRAFVRRHCPCRRRTRSCEARKPVIVARNGIKLGFISYTQFNNFGESAFAADGRPGSFPWIHS